MTSNDAISLNVDELPTPALIIERAALDHNLMSMAAIHPGHRLRPHVKAHKCTALAGRQAAIGHRAFTCATPREMLGMASAGLGDDLLLANEAVNGIKLSILGEAQADARITIAVDSEPTVDAAANAGLINVLIDVNVGLPRCGVAPADAGWLADYARSKSLTVRGVMGYEGHLMMVTDRNERRRRVEQAMGLLLAAHADVGGDVISAGGTGTFDLNDRVTEIQAGSYALMDTHYGQLDLPFQQACFVVGTVISRNQRYAVADVGLKALGMDHGNPAIAGASVWFCSDEHITFAVAEAAAGDSGASSRAGLPAVGDRIRVTPAHIDPTMAMHEVAWLVDGDQVIEYWPINLRGW